MKRECRVIPPTPNEPPTANIKGKNLETRQGTPIELDGSSSKDPEGAKLSYAWKLESKPDDSKATLESKNQPKISFTPDVEGDYIIQLIVEDPEKAKSRPARIKVYATGKAENDDPIANAGDDQVVGKGQDVTLDGSKSSDPENDKLTFKWVLSNKPAGSNAKLSDETAEKPTFKADVEGKYIATLIVNDGLEDSRPDTVTIEAIPNIDLQPEITKVTPAEGYLDTKVDIIIEGKGFDPKATLLFRSRAVPKTDIRTISPTKLEATLSLENIRPNAYDLVVRNPNQKEAKPFKFKVLDIPTPQLTSVTPNAAPTGVTVKITVKGTGFTKQSVIVLETTGQKTTYKSPTELEAEMNLKGTIEKIYKVSVRNPGNRVSGTLDFRVTPPLLAPKLTVLSPPRGQLGTKIAFSVFGTSFAEGAVIYFDGKAVPSARVSRTEVKAEPTLDLTAYSTEKTYTVWVQNIDGQKTATLQFEGFGKNPTPRLDRILPFEVYLDDPTNKLGVYGQNFEPGIKLFLGTKEISGSALSFKSSTYLEAKVDTTKGSWTAGDVQAYVQNTSGKKSKSFKLSITYRVPTISSLTPSGWYNKCDTTVDIFGNNFVKGKSKLVFGSTTYTQGATDPNKKLTYISEKQMQIKLQATKLSSGNYDVLVDNGVSAKSTKVQFTLNSGSAIGTPEIERISPPSGGSNTQVNMELNYKFPNYFRVGATAYLNGKKQQTNCSGTTNCFTMTAVFDLAGIKPGIYPVVVQNPCGNKSNTVPFLVDNPPTPIIGQISPPYVTVGDKRTIQIKGSNFGAAAKLLWGGKELPITVKSDTEIVTKSPVDFSTSKAGTVDIVVDNGYNRKSVTVKYSILDKNASPVITLLSATSFDVGKSYKNVNVNGKGFTKNTKLYFNEKALAGVTFMTSGQLTITTLDFSSFKAGTYTLYAEEAGKKSNQVTVMAKAGDPPTIRYLTQSSMIVGESPVISIYAREFCRLTSPTSTSCIKDPTVVLVDSDGKVVTTKAFTISTVYISSFSGWDFAYVRGSFDSSKLKPGDYLLYLEKDTGERSNPAPVTVRPVPPPVLTKITPNVVAAGGGKVSVTVEGKDFKRGATVRLGLNSIPTIYSSATALFVDIDTSKLAANVYKFSIVNPDKQQSGTVDFTVLPKIPPAITYTNPDVVTPGQKISALYVYGVNLQKGAKLFVNGKAVTYDAGSATVRQLRVDNYTVDAAATKLEIQVENPDKQKSNVYRLGLLDKPYISYLDPNYTTTPGGSEFMRVYGRGFIENKSKVRFDGKDVNVTNWDSFGTSMRITFTAPSTPKVINVTVANGTTISTATKYAVLKSGSMEVNYLRETALLAGTGLFKAGEFYVSGTGFTKTSQIYFNGKALKTKFSSSSRLDVDQVLDLTKLTIGRYSFEVKDGTKTSNPFELRIESGIQQGGRFRITAFPVYWAKIGTRSQLKFGTNYVPTTLLDQYGKAYSVVITGPGFTGSKSYGLIRDGNNWKSNLSTLGWTPGVYSVSLYNNITKESSGGAGLIIFK